MKKLLTIFALFASMTVASAQIGIIGGLTSSKANLANAAKDVKSIALYHAGLTYKIDLGAGFAVQPSLIYQVKGAKIENIGSTSVEQLRSGFVELPIGFQWGPDLLAFRPYGFVEPFIGYRITSSDRGNSSFADWSKQAKNKIEYGFGLGGGIEIASHFQVSVQWFKNLGTMFGESAKSADATWNDVKDFKNFQGIKVSLAILF